MLRINGESGETISAADRGLQYGDGVFRTLPIRQGKVQQWARHYRKLAHDCARIGIACPDEPLLKQDLLALIPDQADYAAKIIITRGISLRGYAPSPGANPTRIVSLSPMPRYPKEWFHDGVKLHACTLRLGHQPHLAGIKHLNRLENVLAAAEWSDSSVAEGLLCDLDGHVIEGTRTNLFFVQAGKLHTPDLSRCGVAGTQRDRVMEWAARNGIPCLTGHYTLEDVFDAEEVFLVNSLIGLWPVRELSGVTWKTGRMTADIQKELIDAFN
ncbi:MAG: aminodeoxychorismate lyase [Pseudomonadota bacterium]